MNTTAWALTAFFVVGGAAVIWNATQPAPAPQGHSMTPPDTSDLTVGEPIAQVKVPAQFSSDAQMGQRVFEAKCAACHGTNAAGQKGIAPPLIHKFYEPNHHSDAAFVLAAKNGVRAHHWDFGDMPKIPGLTEGDVKFVARYIRELQKENGIF